jgi:hypothetical protein
MPSDRSPRERGLLAALCLFGALRVLVFAAAFPFYNNVDEKAHVDLVLKFARGHWPSERVERYDRASGLLFGMYGTWEYHTAPEDMPGGRPPVPMWRMPPEAVEAMRARFASLEPPVNHEAHAPPAYYALAALWYRLGGLLGLDGARRIYWVRFLDAPLCALCVLAAWAFAREAWPGRADLRLAAPLLVACFPQDAFYAVNSDALSAPLVGFGLVLLARWMRREAPGAGLGAALGLVCAAALLVKQTNFPFALVFAGAVAAALVRAARAGRLRAVLPGALAASLAAALPYAAFLARNALVLGDALGQAEKVRQLGWTVREHWLAHPLFSAAGLGRFLATLTAWWWRGEFDWHGRPLAGRLSDAVYVASTAVLFAAALAAALLRRRARRTAPRARRAAPGAAPDIVPDPGPALSWWMVGLSVATLAALSVPYDYGLQPNPSNAFPFFVSGRLVLGALVPFACLYLDGAAWLGARLAGRRAALLCAALIGLFATVSEALLSAPVFASAYNWYHLP